MNSETFGERKGNAMQGFMVVLVSVLLVALAAGTVVFMFMYVLREKHEHTEHYIPDMTSPGEESKSQS
jgi:flagellar biosynthesis protein FliQ